MIITENQIQHLPSDLFEYNPNLETIDFSHNTIITVDADFFMNLNKLKSIKYIGLLRCDEVKGCMNQIYEKINHGDIDKFKWNSSNCTGKGHK